MQWKIKQIMVLCTNLWLIPNAAYAQTDTIYIYPIVQLDSIVISDTQSGFDVASFIKMVQEDTTYYQAFRNIKTVSYTGNASIRMFDKRKLTKATYTNYTKQSISGKCRHLKYLSEQATGDFFDKKGEIDYYTAKLFAHIFLYRDTICNNVQTLQFESQKKSKTESQLEKRKEQLKILVFNPGKPVDGIPFIKNKMAIFNEDMMRYYDYSITAQMYEGVKHCYVFSIKKKPEVSSGDVVIQEIHTWFNRSDYAIIARNYQLTSSNVAFDFDVSMDVKIGLINGVSVPTYIAYNGTWNVPGKSRETGSIIIHMRK